MGNGVEEGLERRNKIGGRISWRRDRNQSLNWRRGDMMWQR